MALNQGEIRELSLWIPSGWVNFAILLLLKTSITSEL